MNDEIAKQTTASLARVQTFDTKGLPRREDLGRELSFDDAVPAANRAINLFRLVPVEIVAQLPEETSRNVRSAADSFFNILEQIRTYSAQQASAVEVRQNIISQLQSGYQSWFNQLMPAINYATSVRQDFSRIEMEARAAAQAAADEAKNLTEKLTEHEAEANRVLDEVRRVAAEQGVGFQAAYFKKEADDHEALAKSWRLYTALASLGVAALAGASLGIHRVPFFVPTNAYEAAQLIAAKLVIFAAAGYVVVLCARNFLAHTHNAIVNRHRQNALLTFQALVNAAKGEDKKDIVLTHASACMFSPQETGFTKHAADSGGPNILQFLTKVPAVEKAS